MRRFLLTAVMAVMASGAQAADMPDFLRGSLLPSTPAPTVNWQGFYIGGQGGVGESNMNFTGATQSVASALLANLALEEAGNVSSWPVGGKVSTRGTGWGGFVGYNSQWDDVVLGVELSYLHGDFGGSQTDSMGRSFTDSLGYTDNVTYRSTAAMTISDMGTVRARAGYAFGSFLPYVFAGVALGQADIVRTADISGFSENANAAQGFTYIPFDYNNTVGQYSHLVYGYSAGLGVDIQLVSCLFLRAEWEYVRFTSAIDTSVNTVRLGLGYKF